MELERSRLAAQPEVTTPLFRGSRPEEQVPAEETTTQEPEEDGSTTSWDTPDGDENEDDTPSTPAPGSLLSQVLSGLRMGCQRRACVMIANSPRVQETKNTSVSGSEFFEAAIEP